jgi:hypothetical protein
MSKPEITYVKDTFEEYLSKKDYIAASDVKNFLHSPLKYYYEKHIKKEEPKGRHFQIGSALHECILEPELFHTNYIVSPKFNRRTKIGKQQHAEFEEFSKEKVVIVEDEMVMIQEMGKSASQNRTLMELLEDCHFEVSCYTTDEKTGLKLRMRPDGLSKSRSTIVDLKSCVDASKKKFKKDIYNYDYSISGSYYSDNLRRENYIFAAIEKTPPHQTALYALNDNMVDYGRQQYRMGLDLIKWSMDNNYWCDYVEFEILKECYYLDSLDDFFDTRDKSDLITIIH